MSLLPEAANSERVEPSSDRCYICLEHGGDEPLLRHCSCRQPSHPSCLGAWLASKDHLPTSGRCEICMDPLPRWTRTPVLRVSVRMLIASMAAFSVAAHLLLFIELLMLLLRGSAPSSHTTIVTLGVLGGTAGLTGLTHRLLSKRYGSPLYRYDIERTSSDVS